MTFEYVILVISFAINVTVVCGILNEPVSVSCSTSGKEEQNVCLLHVLYYKRNH